jgi:Domain of unknown function (DUF4426)
MVRYQRALFATSALLMLSACEQTSAPDPAAGQEEAVVLPGTETSRDFGDYVVHFNSLMTEQLNPDIAREYQIVRSENRVMLNVSILKKSEGGVGTPVPGAVSASAINLTGQLRGMSMREIREGNDEAIYYIGEIAIIDGETLIFTIDVTPINEASRFTVRFKRQFFID